MVEPQPSKLKTKVRFPSPALPVLDYSLEFVCREYGFIDVGRIWGAGQSKKTFLHDFAEIFLLNRKVEHETSPI